ncbi:hypothetical protein EDD66_101178 [Mobilisporobacter senegalensis]|uniref:Flagellar operon protein (TIGR03826 family) n=1 Tax=Mobilisporobacter senegalensis TaxID=1329262 RepID=A0A3N1XZ98_9FIRM|nr:hypothetical protein [Mobilisporobacter senegalensis]ROR31561.1 hypothetical protein EDD66_101178 [Mobilisporobacter senegalensis]
MNKEKILILDNKPYLCTKCGSKYEYLSMGVYKCSQCGFITMDDYGKVRTFLDENGPAPAIKISAGTGVPIEIINRFLREGKLEIPDGSDNYIRCEKCGKAEIRYGRFCPACALELSKKIESALKIEDIGEVPKYKNGKMYFLGK